MLFSLQDNKKADKTDKKSIKTKRLKKGQTYALPKYCAPKAELTLFNIQESQMTVNPIVNSPLC